MITLMDCSSVVEMEVQAWEVVGLIPGCVVHICRHPQVRMNPKVTLVLCQGFMSGVR